METTTKKAALKGGEWLVKKLKLRTYLFLNSLMKSNA